MKSDNFNHDALHFIEVISKLAQKLSPEELLYWSRRKERLFSKLKLDTIDFLQEVLEEKTMIPVLPQAFASESLKGGPFVMNHVSLSDKNLLKHMYKASLETEVVPYLFTCRLSLDEILHAMDDDGTCSVLTPQQVRYLGMKQNQRGRSGQLSFDQATYCLMETKRNRVQLARMFWNKIEEYPLAKNRWNFSFDEEALGGRLLLAV